MLTNKDLSTTNRLRVDWQNYFCHIKSSYLATDNEIASYIKKLEGQANRSIVYYVHDFCVQKNVFVSENYGQVVGYDPQNSLNIPYFIFQISHQDDIAKMLQKGKLAFDYIKKLSPSMQRFSQLRFVYRIIKPNGEMIRVLDTITLTEFDTEGKVSVGVGYLLDVTSLMPFSDQVIGELKLPDGTMISLDLDEQREEFLSKRELEILRMVEAGFSSKEIAHQLGISVNTVHNHRQKMMQRHNCNNMLEVLRQSKEKGLL